jgi:hypothetical protein
MSTAAFADDVAERRRGDGGRELASLPRRAALWAASPSTAGEEDA